MAAKKTITVNGELLTVDNKKLREIGLALQKISIPNLGIEFSRAVEAFEKSGLKDLLSSHEWELPVYEIGGSDSWESWGESFDLPTLFGHVGNVSFSWCPRWGCLNGVIATSVLPLSFEQKGLEVEDVAPLIVSLEAMGRTLPTV